MANRGNMITMSCHSQFYFKCSVMLWEMLFSSKNLISEKYAYFCMLIYNIFVFEIYRLLLYFSGNWLISTLLSGASKQAIRKTRSAEFNRNSYQPDNWGVQKNWKNTNR